MQLRYYQKDCIAALYDWLKTRTDNPLCVLATAAGKSIIIAQFIKTMIQQYSSTRIVCCIDTKELVEQNYNKLLEVWGNAPAGVCSAGLGRKQYKNQILFTGIQSIYRHANKVGPTDILIIDETHMSNLNQDSMWHQFITELSPRIIIGFTATPYRNDCGLIYTGENAIYGGVAYEYTVKQGISDGYLSTIIPKTMTTHFDMQGVKTHSGDFAEGEMQARVNIDEKNESVVDEIERYGHDRKAWLIFSAGCDHAHELDAILSKRGYKGAVVLGDTPNQKRDEYIKDFKGGRLKYLINNAVLTKGFDAPHIDLIAAVRPTKSPVLWTQMIGRGLRLAEGKENCLLLDFAENVFRFGFVDEMVFTDKKDKKGDKEGVPPVKTCEECDSIVPAGVRECPFCGYEFPKPQPEINEKAYGGAVLSTQVVAEWKEVEDVFYAIHKSKKPTPTLKVEYICKDFERYFEYICLEHEAGSFPRGKAIRWWMDNVDKYQAQDIDVVNWLRTNGYDSIPKTIKDAFLLSEILIKPSKVKVIQDGKFWKVLERDNSKPALSHQPEPEYSHGFSEEELF